MGSELVKTERKWLATALSLENFRVKRVILQLQGYIAPPNGRKGFLRLRQEQPTENKEPIQYFLTIKSAEVFNEDPPDHDISEREFHILWPWTEGRRVQKRRHQIELDGRIYDYDIYQFSNDPELHILETEFATEAEAKQFILPTVFGEVRDVSDDPRYKADGIATDGRPPLP